jgi:hypothetical protein
MVGQAFHVLGQALGIEGLQGLDNPGVQAAPPLLQEAAVGHLMRQGVLKGVLVLREETRFVQELGRLELCEAAVQRFVGRVGNGLQQRPGHLGADHGGGLEEAFILR